MRFTRDLHESKVIRSREQFRKFILYNIIITVQRVAVFFIHKRILFMLLFRTPGSSFVVQACLVLLLLGEQDRAARRRRIANARNTFSTRNGKSRKCEGTPLPRRVLLKIRAQGTCRNGKLFRRRRDISAADAGRDAASIYLRILRNIIFISKCTFMSPALVEVLER